MLAEMVVLAASVQRVVRAADFCSDVQSELAVDAMEERCERTAGRLLSSAAPPVSVCSQRRRRLSKSSALHRRGSRQRSKVRVRIRKHPYSESTSTESVHSTRSNKRRRSSSSIGGDNFGKKAYSKQRT